MQSDMLKKYYGRLKVFRRHGLDIVKTRYFILEKSGIKKGDSVLEVGTGKGHAAISMARKKINVTTIDIDKESLHIARNNLKAFGLSRYVKIKRMNVEHLKYANGCFDYVISVNFIHHAKRPYLCIKEMLRVAGKGVVIADFNKQGERLMDRIHKEEGRTHERSAIALAKIKTILQKSSMKVKTYRDKYLTLFVAKKG